MARRKQLYVIRHGETLNECVLDNLGRLGVMFHELYKRITDDYGTVSKRTVHRRLVKLRLDSKILKVYESQNEIYYRLSKTVNK